MMSLTFCNIGKICPGYGFQTLHGTGLLMGDWLKPVECPNVFFFFHAVHATVAKHQLPKYILFERHPSCTMVQAVLLRKRHVQTAKRSCHDRTAAFSPPQYRLKKLPGRVGSRNAAFSPLVQNGPKLHIISLSKVPLLCFLYPLPQLYHI